MSASQINHEKLHRTWRRARQRHGICLRQENGRPHGRPLGQCGNTARGTNVVVRPEVIQQEFERKVLAVREHGSAMSLTAIRNSIARRYGVSYGKVYKDTTPPRWCGSPRYPATDFCDRLSSSTLLERKTKRTILLAGRPRTTTTDARDSSFEPLFADHDELRTIRERREVNQAWIEWLRRMRWDFWCTLTSHRPLTNDTFLRIVNNLLGQPRGAYAAAGLQAGPVSEKCHVHLLVGDPRSVLSAPGIRHGFIRHGHVRVEAYDASRGAIEYLVNQADEKQVFGDIPEISWTGSNEARASGS